MGGGKYGGDSHASRKRLGVEDERVTKAGRSLTVSARSRRACPYSRGVLKGKQTDADVVGLAKADRSRDFGRRVLAVLHNPPAAVLA
jgi:hypothetical protein